MLIQFRCKNFKSFYEETVLDMTATQEQRHSDCLLEKNGNKVLPVVAIHGANAAGKTNILDALYKMSYFVVRSLDFDPRKEWFIPSFAFNAQYSNEPTEFEVFLNVADIEYQYGFIANDDKIMEEWLYTKPFRANTTVKRKKIFEREGKITLGEKVPQLESFKQLFQSLSNNDKTLFLSVLGRRQEKTVKPLFRWFDLNNFIDDSVEAEQDYTWETLSQSQDLRSLMKDMLAEIDPCISDFKIEKQETLDHKTKYQVFLIHQDANHKKKKYPFPIQAESKGTQKALTLLPHVFVTLATGNALFVDELDIRFHPLLYRKIIHMFTDRKTNFNQAQLVYTAHSTYLLTSKEMRRDQIYLVDKNKEGLSSLYSLADFEKLRGDSDYEKKYLAGEFGAIPFQEE